MFPLIDEPRLQSEPREGVPDVIDTLPAFRDYCDLLAAGTGSLAADAERASGYRYGHEDWLVQFKRTGAEYRPARSAGIGASGGRLERFQSRRRRRHVDSA